MLRDRVQDLKYEMLCERTKRRQEAAKAALVRRGVLAEAARLSRHVPMRVRLYDEA